MITEPQAAIFIDYHTQGYSIGLAMMEPYGLGGWFSEILYDTSHPYGAIDRLLHFLFITDSRRLIIGASSRKIFDEIVTNFTMFDYRYEDKIFDSSEQNALFKEVFSLHTLLSPLEHLSLERKPLSAQALSLLVYTFRREENLVLSLPKLLDMTQLMELGNNALEQLEMISSNPRLVSIAKLFLNMSTPMGKRLGRFRLFLPLKEGRELNRRFEWIEIVNPHSVWFRQKLQNLGDIEFLWWQIRNRVHAVYDDFRNAIGIVMEIQRFCIQHKLRRISPSITLLDGWDVEFQNNGFQRQWLEEQLPFMRETIDWIAQIDVAVTSALNAQQYGLTRPVIVESLNGNFLQISHLRHLLVESQGVEYIPNDIVMGNRDYLDLPYPDTVMLDSKVHDGANIRGVLLYGINSSGKSSLMKSIGIAVTLAQAGFFVPAKAMKFSLFDGVYTRIQSRDNVAKSLSTFGVEMLELNTIFSRATSRSLVLGDEISHGTETLSAVAIVASTIMELNTKGCLFLMTTHLHQLSMISELSRLREVVHLHLSVRYDESSDRLVYDRILKSGRGSSVYGLEFAESLHMNPNFLYNAKRLRENLAKEYDVLELGNQKEYIKRYREVVASECVICGALVRNLQKSPVSKEHHHLIALCETHSRQISQGKIKLRGFIMTPQGLRLEYETQLKED
ncbi:MutS-related protein [Sulfuricurvum sp.]|uniref:MutS-related protein n=1 Tax=Sulfuricurvum sp. TaxID=2025608 RepID=UPI003BB73F9F